MKNWLEVSLTVDGELAEAIADVLARFAPNGVITEQGVKFTDRTDPGTPSGPIVVRAFLEIDERIEETRHKLEESLFYLGMIQPLPAPVYKQIKDQNWMEAWKQHYEPIPVGEKLIIVPVWLDSPDPERIPIKIDPGMAFGTGTHPTTQLSLALLEEAIKDMALGNGPEAEKALGRRLPTVIDVGCGSGILSIAALKLGVKTALGVDIDIESVRNSRTNAAENSIGEEFIIGQGSVSEVVEGKFPFKSAPLVVANILAPIILRLFDMGLADLVEPGGNLILSGILQEHEKNVLDIARLKGLVMESRKQIGDWVAFLLSKPT